MDILSRDILVDNLLAAKIHLNNHGIFVRRSPINSLPLFSTLTGNSNGFLLFRASVSPSGSHAEGISLLVSGFGIHSTDGSAEGVGSVSGKSATNIVTKTVFFSLGLSKINTSQTSTSSEGKLAIIEDASYDFFIGETKSSTNGKILNVCSCGYVRSLLDWSIQLSLPGFFQRSSLEYN